MSITLGWRRTTGSTFTRFGTNDGSDRLNEIELPKAEIRELIPHSGTMCLLDAVLRWDDDSIICVTQSHRELDNPLRRMGRLSAVHLFEYGAQAAAIHGGLRARAARETAPPGYLAALRDAHLYVARLDDITSPLRVEAKRLFGEAVNTVYQCEISADERLLGHGRVTIIVRT